MKAAGLLRFGPGEVQHEWTTLLLSAQQTVKVVSAAWASQCSADHWTVSHIHSDTHEVAGERIERILSG